jgi:anthranilate synthase/aminodeoxychorismate synthase-like glutamine amidotransferase
MRVLILDNNDSFTFNIVDMLRKLDGIKFSVRLSEDFNVSEMPLYKAVIISPGPMKPVDYPILKEVIDYCCVHNISLLGICLGHQAICEFFGAELVQLNEVVHGRQIKINHLIPCKIYENLGQNQMVGLYHSWTVKRESVPIELLITAETDDHRIMSVRHAQKNIFGVQYHPESFLTPNGPQILINFLQTLC